MTSEFRPEDLRPNAPANAELSIWFHQVDSLIPDDQEIAKVRSNVRAREALKIMRKEGYSQLPVVEGKTVIGLFSYRSFAEKAEVFFSLGKDPYAAEVIDLVEDPEYITADSNLDELIRDRKSVV